MRMDELTLVRGEPGFMVVGMYPTVHSIPAPPEILDLWPADAQGEPYTHHGPGWIAHLWDVEITTWPADDAWRPACETTLRRLQDSGAAVAWIGTDLDFLDPPGMFENGEHDVFAALSPPTGFACSVGAHGELGDAAYGNAEAPSPSSRRDHRPGAPRYRRTRRLNIRDAGRPIWITVAPRSPGEGGEGGRFLVDSLFRGNNPFMVRR